MEINMKHVLMSTTMNKRWMDDFRNLRIRKYEEKKNYRKKNSTDNSDNNTVAQLCAEREDKADSIQRCTGTLL